MICQNNEYKQELTEALIYELARKGAETIQQKHDVSNDFLMKREPGLFKFFCLYKCDMRSGCKERIKYELPKLS